jgi:dipeptidase E
MKLLLTSNGLANESIALALEELVGKPRRDIKIAFIPTAAFPQDEARHESRDWLVDDLTRIKEFCGYIDIVSLADLAPEEVIKRLEYADVIFVGGGNTFYLSYMFEKLGLFDALPHLLETRVYAGISAGSMLASASLRSASQAINSPEKFYDELYDELGPVGFSSVKSAHLVDFLVRPHYLSRVFPDAKGDFLENIVQDSKLPLYAIDDQTALKIIDGHVEVVTEGRWRLIDLL